MTRGNFERNVSELRNRVKAGEEGADIHQVFHGTDDWSEIGNPPPTREDRWVAAERNIGEFLAEFATVFLASDPYNAAKHGLALAAGASRFELKVDDVVIEEFGVQGPSIQYATKRSDGGRDGWGLATKWVDPGWSIAASLAAATLIQQLWCVARRTYLGDRLEGFNLLDELRLEDLQRADPALGRMVKTVNFPNSERAEGG